MTKPLSPKAEERWRAENIDSIEVVVLQKTKPISLKEYGSPFVFDRERNGIKTHIELEDRFTFSQKPNQEVPKLSYPSSGLKGTSLVAFFKQIIP